MKDKKILVIDDQAMLEEMHTKASEGSDIIAVSNNPDFNRRKPEHTSPPRVEFVAVMLVQIGKSGAGNFHFDWDKADPKDSFRLLDHEVEMIKTKRSALSVRQRQSVLALHRRLNRTNQPTEKQEVVQ